MTQTVLSWLIPGLITPISVATARSTSVGVHLCCRYPAELRAEVYYPWYFQRQRPVIRSVANNDNPHAYSSSLTISVQVTGLNQREMPPYLPVIVKSTVKYRPQGCRAKCPFMPQPLVHQRSTAQHTTPYRFTQRSPCELSRRLISQ